MILKCSCKHEFQDAIYGKELRVHNRAPKSKYGDWRCTVCGNHRNAPSGSDNKTKKE